LYSVCVRRLAICVEILHRYAQVYAGEVHVTGTRDVVASPRRNRLAYPKTYGRGGGVGRGRGDGVDLGVTVAVAVALAVVVAVAVAVALAVAVGLGVGVGAPPHVSNLKLTMRVRQLKLALGTE